MSKFEKKIIEKEKKRLLKMEERIVEKDENIKLDSNSKQDLGDDGYKPMTFTIHPKESKILNGINSNDPFYFVHSFHARTSDKSIILGTTNYETEFVCALEKENICGVQFHPEKSHEVGLQLLRNFVEKTSEN